MQELIKGDEAVYYYSPEDYDPLLDYVGIIAEEYYPPTPIDYESGYVFSKGIGIFADRYFKNNIDKSFEEKFLANKNVQKTIAAFGYDVDKFWYLLLFVYDFSCGMCVNGIVLNKSPKEHLKKLSNAIFENLETYDGNTNKVSFKSSTKIVLKINKKQKISIEDPITILHLAEICHIEVDKIKADSLLSQSITEINLKNEKIVGQPSINSVHIWYFTNMFLKFFDLMPPIKGRHKKGTVIYYDKHYLISKLIYIIGLSRNENFDNSLKTLKGYLKPFKDFNLDVANGIYY